MGLTIETYTKHYVVRDTASGLTLCVLSKKALEWNLKHAFGLKAARIKQINTELQEKGSIKVAV